MNSLGNTLHEKKSTQWYFLFSRSLIHIAVQLDEFQAEKGKFLACLKLHIGEVGNSKVCHSVAKLFVKLVQERRFP